MSTCEVFNKLMSARSCTFNYFEKIVPKGFKDSHVFTRGGARSTLGIFKPNGNIKYSRWVLIEINNKYLRANPSQEGVFNM